MLVVDLEKAKTTLNETFSEMLGTWTKKILKFMYGDDVKVVANINESEDKPDFVIRGKYKDVKAYAMAVTAEKEFLDAYRDFGTNHPQTQKRREELRNKVDDFEQITTLKWPFKDED